MTFPQGRVVTPAIRPASPWYEFECPVCGYPGGSPDENALISCPHPNGPFGQKRCYMKRRDAA